MTLATPAAVVAKPGGHHHIFDAPIAERAPKLSDDALTGLRWDICFHANADDRAFA